jgi:carbonic anhydrase
MISMQLESLIMVRIKTCSAALVTAVTLLSTPFIASTASGTSEESEWGYAGEYGPENWGSLSTGFDMCSRGRNQSPIDLVADIHGDLPELSFEYTHLGHPNEINTGHSIQENIRPGNYVTIAGDRYELKQFHFHSPSEHLVGGKEYPMEIHLVHQDERGNFAVIGLFLTEGKHNAMLDQLPSFRSKRGEDPYSDPVDYNDLIQFRREYFYYNGSLTTPPCTEGVTWLILKEPLLASPAQIQHYHDLLGFDNNRPVQPHNSRLIVE